MERDLLQIALRVLARLSDGLEPTFADIQTLRSNAAPSDGDLTIAGLCCQTIQHLLANQTNPLSSTAKDGIDTTQEADAKVSGRQSLVDVERHHIERVLHSTEGNLSKTARILGINRSTLYRKLSQYGLR